MKAILIEDKKETGTDLADWLTGTMPGLEILARFRCPDSVAEWLRCHSLPDIIIVAAHNGQSAFFEPFRTLPVSCPIFYLPETPDNPETPGPKSGKRRQNGSTKENLHPSRKLQP